MIMTAFRVENYRSVIDSGWINVQDVTLIVGKNESGKTSLLKALCKFNPFIPEPYDPNREWPRGRRKEYSGDKTVVTVRFSFSSAEQKKLAGISRSTQHITGAEIQRTYDGIFIYNFLPSNPPGKETSFITNVIKKHFADTTITAIEHLKAGYQDVLNAVMRQNELHRQEAEQTGESVAVAERAATAVLPQPAYTPNKSFLSQPALQAPVSGAIKELNENLPMRQAVEMVHAWIPTFVYMDDYKVFKGTAQLDELKKNKDTGQLSEEDRTVIKILEMAGLNVDDEYQKSTRVDKEQRMLDMNDASQKLTEEIAHRWTQKKYEVFFQADGNHLITFVKDASTNILVPLEERSKGFQWFFSFDMTFMYETNGDFKNAIILLDEPGLHLHATAQRDLIARIREYAKNNQLIYTTHLPFMIDFSRLDCIYVAEDNGRDGTKAYFGCETTDKDSRFTLQAAFGLSWAQSLISDQYSLIVEDITDFWLLTFFSQILQGAGQQGLDPRLVITPTGGASKISFAGTLLHDQGQKVVILLNYLPENYLENDLMNSWMVRDGHVILVSNIIKSKDACTLEDLLPEQYYLDQVNAVYKPRLGGIPLTLTVNKNQPIIQRIVEALHLRNIRDFDRVKVARRIILDMEMPPSSILTQPTITLIAELISTINRKLLKGLETTVD